MRFTILVFAIALAGCVTSQERNAPWQFRSIERGTYTRSSRDGTAPLVARAKTDFRLAPVAAFGDLRTLILASAAHDRAGRPVLSFYVAGVEDVEAVYVFDQQGRIIDRFLRSDWN